MPRKILDYEVVGRCFCGRPKERWKDNMQENLMALGLRPELAQDRAAWRRAIKPQEEVKVTTRRNHPTPTQRKTVM